MLTLWGSRLTAKTFNTFTSACTRVLRRINVEWNYVLRLVLLKSFFRDENLLFVCNPSIGTVLIAELIHQFRVYLCNMYRTKYCEIFVARYKIYKDFRFEIFAQFICRRYVTDATKVIINNFFYCFFVLDGVEIKFFLWTFDSIFIL